EESVNRSNLYPGAPTAIPQIGGLDMIIAIRDEKRYCRKAIHNLRTGLRTRKTLQDLLQDQASCNDRLARFNRPSRRLHFGHRRRRIAPERQRPDTGVNEEGQSRRRSAL